LSSSLLPGPCSSRELRPSSRHSSSPRLPPSSPAPSPSTFSGPMWAKNGWRNIAAAAQNTNHLLENAGDGESAVNGDDLTSNVRSRRKAEESHDGGHFLRLADPA